MGTHPIFESDFDCLTDMNFEDILKDHPNLATEDLNQVWKVLSQLRSSNPKKYQQFIDHVKIQQEKDEKTNSLQPVPKKIYQINASLLSEKFIFYINILSWERLKYPEGDSPISMLLGEEIQPRKGELITHIAINDRALDEILATLEKEFRNLICKFISDNFPKYRFYNNTIRAFERKNDIQYYGKLPKDPRVIFLKKSKKQKEPNLLDLVHKIPEEEPEPEPSETTILDALEDEMKKAKIIETDPKIDEKTEQKPETQKEIKTEPKTVKIEIIEKEPENPEPPKPEIPEVPKEVIPVFREDNSHPEYYRILIGLPGISFDQVQSHISPEKLIVHVPGKYHLEQKLPENLKDESVRAKFNHAKCKLTLKIPRAEFLGPSKADNPEPEFVDKNFMKNLQKGLNLKGEQWETRKT